MRSISNFYSSSFFARRLLLPLLSLTVVLLSASQVRSDTPPRRKSNVSALSETAVRFARAIQPILAEKCYRCHGPDNQARQAGLRLDTEAGVRQAFAPGKPEGSRAYLRITEKSQAMRMPPPGSNLTLTPTQVGLLRRWIKQGAKWEKHWAFIPPTRPQPPAVQNKKWLRNPIDAFVLARLEREGLKPSPAAERATLLRRVSLDLTGLPPTPQELQEFLKDRSPHAYEEQVDRLLDSPRFGERMAWDWLDVARYADTNGYQEDRTRTLWPWRDWVIGAFNSNMPYDQFVIEQIAGDLLPDASIRQKIATGFNRNHMLNGEGGRIPEESRVEYVLDRVDTTSTALLGLTLGCARCHDHKYDPFTQKEYYQLSAYYNSIAETGEVDRNGNANPVLALPTEEQTRRKVELQDTIDYLNQKIATLNKNAPTRAGLQKQLDDAKSALNKLNDAVLATMVMEDRKEPRDTFILIRGAYDKHGDKVGCGTPAVLPPLKDGSGSRLALALWIAGPDNPLTARVAVNRLWQMLFGTGLVKTAEDFGVQGERPSHPELLDWLATEFVRRNWDVKAMLKLMVESATYRQSSRMTPALLEKDPENRLLARGPRYRLPSWMLRDQALALSGLLVEKVGGPPVKPYQPEGVWEDFSYGKITYQQDHGAALYRRSLYIFWRRSVAPTILFDTASRRVCQVRTARTNTPLQALTLLNETSYVEAARLFAEQAMKQAGAMPAKRIAVAFQSATARSATVAERTVLLRCFQRNLAYYTAHREEAEKLLSVGEWKRDPSLDVAELAAYTNVMRLILNLDEVLSKE